MKLNIISSSNFKILDILYIEVSSKKGSFVVQKNHAPLIAVLKDNQDIVIMLKDGSKIIEHIDSGIIKVERDCIDLIVG
jgi:F0F1-type ATP synthase epsilon subunit